jgi:hypothetical protein
MLGSKETEDFDETFLQSSFQLSASLAVNSSLMNNQWKTEPLLTPNPKRFVLFPIQYPEASSPCNFSIDLRELMEYSISLR